MQSQGRAGSVCGSLTELGGLLEERTPSQASKGDHHAECRRERGKGINAAEGAGCRESGRESVAPSESGVCSAYSSGFGEAAWGRSWGCRKGRANLCFSSGYERPLPGLNSGVWVLAKGGLEGA